MSITHILGGHMKFKEMMINKKITQNELADRLGVHQTLISQWCCGKGMPSIMQVGTVAEVLGVPVTEVIACFEKKR